MSEIAPEGNLSSTNVPADALAALDNAMASDGYTDSGQAFVAPPGDGFDPGNTGLPAVEPTPDAATQPEVVQAPPVAPEAPTPAADSFTEKFDPNTLPPELVPAYKAMQADYTRKRQADAEAVRFAQQYEGVDLNTAVELFQRIQNPDGLLSFVQEAGEYLANQGLAEWDDPAATPAAPVENNQLSQTLDQLAASDPDMAPLAEAVKAMQSRLDSFETQTSERLEAEREETEMLQALGEVQRQENIIRTDFPQYDQNDIDSIYEIASHHDGNLLAAQESYEAAFARRLGRFMHQKDAQPEPAVPTGLPAPLIAAEPNFDPLDSKAAHAAALETLKLIENQPG